MNACHLLLRIPWLYDTHVTYDGYANTYSLKHNTKSLTLAPLPPPNPHKIKLGKVSEKSPYMSETQKYCTTSKSKPWIFLLMVKPNISEGVKPVPPLARQELEDETSKTPIPKVPLPIKMVLGEDPYASDQATSYTSMSMMILRYLVMSTLRSSMSLWGLGELLNALMFF